MHSTRQNAILAILEQNRQMSAPQLLAELLLSYPKLSKPTVLRDLSTLIQAGNVIRTGKARSVKYHLSSFHQFLTVIDTDKYFLDPPDKRIIKPLFNWNIFSGLTNIFGESELVTLNQLNSDWQKRRANFPPTAIKKELERLTIELSWKSSQLEGNTYSLLDTEQLVTKAVRAVGHSNEEADMILGHKNALGYILSNPSKFKSLGADSIRAVHSMIVKNLGIPDDWRKILVGITGSAYKPLDNQWQIQEAVGKSCTVINAEPAPIVKAFLAGALIAYIQPFVDGNKRTGRLITDAVLWAHDWCPLSYRSIDEIEYKKAILLIYEQNNFRLLKKLFVEQFEFAVKNYFGE